ncbi:uncharacterized protein MONBRDRAFT_22786 [Monosiga brevicollis MX1]|uniref:PPM-type phosphatase domain-containing protein n=1 Tax=Monosiga brevicollis TaxID=81824 RepID=A9US29_MONBE|nr:uncharacterized protein MONBRDRAFT_22786 [Monosiga brevicollis MX1]EDQ91707.1 predicted protein [Monosiga brevicollis MX1]|eukprot:XP_001742993.1 hypothetical protein [Monosiga brevicollis MX1]
MLNSPPPDVPTSSLSAHLDKLGELEEAHRIVQRALDAAFVDCHKAMHQLYRSWPQRRDKHYSTAGTTATLLLCTRHDLFLANVGDSDAFYYCLGADEPQCLTVSHLPNIPSEVRRIRNCGGRISAMRVCWTRLSASSGQRVSVPFLNMTRALGDFWSWNPASEAYIVDPHPHTCHRLRQPDEDDFVIMASDGLWDCLPPATAGVVVRESLAKNCCPAPALVECALQFTRSHNIKCDNVSVTVVFLRGRAACPLHASVSRSSRASTPCYSHHTSDSGISSGYAGSLDAAGLNGSLCADVLQSHGSSGYLNA